jgi:hypothetical protein
MTLAESVAELERERNRLARQVQILNDKLLEVTDPKYEASIVRRAYRRGYLSGRAAQRRGAVAVTNPEKYARTWVREMVGRA